MASFSPAQKAQPPRGPIDLTGGDSDGGGAAGPQDAAGGRRPAARRAPTFDAALTSDEDEDGGGKSLAQIARERREEIRTGKKASSAEGGGGAAAERDEAGAAEGASPADGAAGAGAAGSGETGAKDAKGGAAKQDVAAACGGKNDWQVPAAPADGSTPLTIPDKFGALTGARVLLQLPPDFDMMGDSGAVGRVSDAVPGEPGGGGVQVDLKGVLYDCVAAPSATLMVVSKQDAGAKVEMLTNTVVRMQKLRGIDGGDQRFGALLRESDDDDDLDRHGERCACDLRRPSPRARATRSLARGLAPQRPLLTMAPRRADFGGSQRVRDERPAKKAKAAAGGRGGGRGAGAGGRGRGRGRGRGGRGGAKSKASSKAASKGK